MKTWLKQRIAELDDTPDDIAGEYLSAVIDEAARRAAVAGLPAVVEVCQIRSGPVGVDLARRVLSKCLATCQQPADKQESLSVKQVAQRLAVAPDSVRDWIHAGRLKAANVGKGKQRGRYRIAVVDLESFMASRQPDPPATRRKVHKPRASFQRDYT